MSHRLISRSGDLKQLRDEGYNIEIHPSVHLLVKDVPYVDEARTVQRGTLISKLDLADDVTLVPTDHTVRFIGSHPCRSTATKNDHISSRIPFTEPAANNEYTTNIQIADLNALNAALAVIKWKKHFGFYSDLEHEHFSAYTIDGNHLLNEDNP